MRMLILAAAACAVIAAPAAAQGARSSLTLAEAGAASAEAVIIDGASWRCEGATCVASGGQNQPATRACRRVVARLGAVSAFTYRGVTLSNEQIAACNG